jgi:hypothetical protein
MAYDGWIRFGDIELINLARTAQLAEVMGIDAVWTEPAAVQWIADALLDADYSSVESAPWYDSGVPASAEFAGLVPLGISGLDDSTRESVTVEYITNGGSSGKPRNKTLAIVANVAVIASTNRGADYGKRWLDRVLAGTDKTVFCSGDDLRYFRHAHDEGLPEPEQVHRRDVTVTRGTSVTRKREGDCSVVWFVTFTWTANDPFEYGDPVGLFTNLGGEVAVPLGAGATTGSLALTETGCPVFDYTPIYDPLYPALVEGPAVPDFYPDGWDLVPGVTINREWVKFNAPEPSSLGVVPVVTLTTEADARFVRVSIWPDGTATDEQCDPLWTAIVSYLPAGVDFVLDGEQEAVYVWDGFSPSVRRADSLAWHTGARPMQWPSFNDAATLMVTLDTISTSGGDYDGGGTVRAALSVVSKSD